MAKKIGITETVLRDAHQSVHAISLPGCVDLDKKRGIARVTAIPRAISRESPGTARWPRRIFR